jgi:RHS repeat-associated protein
VDTSTAAIYYIHTDHLGTPRVITNQPAQVVWRWDNDDPFGANAANENPSGLGTFSCNLRFPGQYFDKETNLHYNYFRDYDPAMGRYIQADPLGVTTTGGPMPTTLSHLYAYSLNDPLRFFDPEGLEVQTCCGMTSALPNASVMIGLECMSKCLGATIYISSGKRSPGQNKQTPGAAANSYHLEGIAADVHIPPSKAKIRRAASECGFFVYAKDYPTWVHVDLRGGRQPKTEADNCVCQQIRSQP